MQMTTAVRNARLSAFTTALTGAGAGTLKIYTGASPGVGVAVPTTQTLLSTLTAVVMGAPAAGTMSISSAADTSAAASGTPGFVRLAGGATAITDFTAGVGSGEFNFGGTISLGGTVTLSSGTITEGNA